MAQELKAHNVVCTADVNLEVVDNLGCEEWSAYDKDEVDTVLAAKDAEIAELKTKLENVDELVKAANKFVADLKSSDCSKKDEEIEKLKKSVKFFSETLERERESAKKCFMKLHDDGLLMGWGLTKVFFVMPKYTKERLTQFEKQESEIESLKASHYAEMVDAGMRERKLNRALWIARAKRAIEKISWFRLWNASISTMNPEDGARQEFDRWKKNLGKLLAKAEEYR